MQLLPQYVCAEALDPELSGNYVPWRCDADGRQWLRLIPDQDDDTNAGTDLPVIRGVPALGPWQKLLSWFRW